MYTFAKNKNRKFGLLTFIFSLLLSSQVFAAVQQVKFISDIPEMETYFGDAVSVSDNTAVVGSRRATVDGSRFGAVFVYDYDGTSWVETAKLVPIRANEEFGGSVSISGNKIVIGARTGTLDSIFKSGAAFVYEPVGGIWTQTAVLKASDIDRFDSFGASVSIQGNRIVVGSVGNDDIADRSGSAYIFDYDGKQWSEVAKLTASDASENAAFGHAVDVDGDRVVVSANLADDAVIGINVGNVYVFEKVINSWNETALLGAPDRDTGDGFGGAISLSGDKLIVGASTNDDNGLNSGSAYFFEYTTSWDAGTKVIASDGATNDNFGYSVSIDGNKALIGAISNDDLNSGNSGSVYSYFYNSSNWVNTQLILHTDSTRFTDSFGSDISLDGDRAIIGSAFDDQDQGQTFNSGAAYIFDVDEKPVAVLDTVIINEDIFSTNITVLNNDTDPDGGTKIITAVSQPSNGATTIEFSDTIIKYFPNANYCNDGVSTDDFTYTVNGGSTTTVEVTVTCIDDLPVAVDNGVEINEDLGVVFIRVLNNDTDVDGGPLFVDSYTQPSNGTVGTSGPTLSYSPGNNYCNDSINTDNFTYTLNGGSTATVSVFVNCVDDLPEAVADTVVVNEDAGAFVLVVLANDTDVENDPISISSVSQPSNGTVVNNGINVTYTPDENYCNDGNTTDDFTYTINGGASASVVVTVTCVDDLPVAVDNGVEINEDLGVVFIRVLNNDTDVDGGPLFVDSYTQPSNGTVGTSGPTLSYSPDDNYCNDSINTDNFTYTLNGGSTATVSVFVNCVDDLPEAVADTAVVNEDAGAVVLVVLANDTDVENDPISISSVSQPSNGTIVNNSINVTYSPDENYCNDGNTTDNFTYTINGGASASVAVTVTCVDDLPVAVEDIASLDEDDSSVVLFILENDTDVDDGPKLITSITQPFNGNLINNSNNVTYTPNENYCNDSITTDDFTYVLNGGSSATVSISVNCIDDLPVATDDTAFINEDDNTMVIDVLSNDTDVDGGIKEIGSITQPNNGTVSFTANNLSYTVDNNYCNFILAPDTFTYTLTDGSTASVLVFVNCINDAPSFMIDGDLDFDSTGNSQVSITNFADNYIFGPENESTQQIIGFNVSINSDGSSVIDTISLDNNGTLNIDFTLNTGVAIVSVVMQDNGGTNDGGIDTSNPVEFNVSFTDVIFSSGFEDQGGEFAVLSLLETIALNYPNEIHPVYDFATDSIEFYGHWLELESDYSINITLNRVKLWLNEILSLESPNTDFDQDGTINTDDLSPFIPTYY